MDGVLRDKWLHHTAVSNELLLWPNAPKKWMHRPMLAAQSWRSCGCNNFAISEHHSHGMMQTHLVEEFELSDQQASESGVLILLALGFLLLLFFAIHMCISEPVDAHALVGYGYYSSAWTAANL